MNDIQLMQLGCVMELMHIILLLVPIDGRENQSYFKTLVEELCQLEV